MLATTNHNKTPYDKSVLDDEEILDELRGAIGSCWKNYSMLAAETGVSIGTISRLCSKETKRPRMHTVYALARAVGYKLVLVPANRKCN